MKKISLKNVKETLTRIEMKAINGGSADDGGGGGGGDCCGRQWRDYSPPLTGQYSSVACTLTEAAAKSYAAGGAGGGNWCCGDGCKSASWL